MSSSLHLHIFVQPPVAEQFASIINEDSITRREVNEKPAEQILVEDGRSIGPRFLEFLEVGKQIHRPIIRIELGAAVAGSCNLDGTKLECPSWNSINEQEKREENRGARQEIVGRSKVSHRAKR